jgi:1-acyl-sn-glycerol-3-phosphate acyltransferase
MTYYFFRTLAIIVFSFAFRIKIINKSNLPESGACIYCLNHKSFYDPILVSAFFRRKPAFLAKEELFKNPIIKFFLIIAGAIPVKRNSGDISAIKSALKVLNKDRILTIFPEGRRVKENIKKSKVKPGIALIALKAKVPVVPIAINGKYRFWNKITFVVGKPIELTKYYDEKLSMDEYQKISEDIMEKVREIQEA